jgi:hypothetical protein
VQHDDEQNLFEFAQFALRGSKPDRTIECGGKIVGIHQIIVKAAR